MDQSINVLFKEILGHKSIHKKVYGYKFLLFKREINSLLSFLVYIKAASNKIALTVKAILNFKLCLILESAQHSYSF